MLSFSLLCFSEKNPKTEISDHMQNHASVKLWTTEIELFEMKFEKKEDRTLVLNIYQIVCVILYRKFIKQMTKICCWRKVDKF